MSSRKTITARDLTLTPDELHRYRKLFPKVAPLEHLLEELVDSLLHRAPEGYAIVKKPELQEKGVPVERPWA